MPKVPDKPPVAVPLPALSNHDRVTMNVMVRHEHRGDQPLGVDLVGFTRKLNDKEQPYQRRFTVGEIWKKIDYSWLKDLGVSFVVLENLEGRDLQIRPSEEERKAIDSKIVEVAYRQESKESDLLYPGGMLVKSPVDNATIYARCRSGDCTCKITALPPII